MGGRLMRFFQTDNPVFSFISRIGDIMLLSFLWLTTSIPIITIGASTTALFDCCIRIIRSRDSSIIKDYFKAFKSNFKQSTIIFLIMAAVGGVILADMYFWAHSELEFAMFMNAVSIGIAVLFCATLLFVFTVQAVFENTVKATIRTAFLMLLKHWPTTIALLAGAGAIGYLCYMVPAVAYIFLIFGTGAFGMIYSLQFVNIFKQHNEVIAEDMRNKQWDKKTKEEQEAENALPSKSKYKHKGKVIR